MKYTHKPSPSSPPYPSPILRSPCPKISSNYLSSFPSSPISKTRHNSPSRLNLNLPILLPFPNPPRLLQHILHCPRVRRISRPKLRVACYERSAKTEDFKRVFGVRGWPFSIACCFEKCPFYVPWLRRGAGFEVGVEVLEFVHGCDVVMV